MLKEQQKVPDAGTEWCTSQRLVKARGIGEIWAEMGGRCKIKIQMHNNLKGDDSNCPY